ncbi:hypothetical protein IQ61_21825 [Streptomyces scabiei]|nr:hypothetical protein IQ61_21825 [Streptomyces scabiei]
MRHGNDCWGRQGDTGSCHLLRAVPSLTTKPGARAAGEARGEDVDASHETEKPFRQAGSTTSPTDLMPHKEARRTGEPHGVMIIRIFSEHAVAGRYIAVTA